jgi:hypothetical protein
MHGSRRTRRNHRLRFHADSISHLPESACLATVTAA